ncbi:MAG TPA: AAA family ATPase [Jiangellales bacterium]|nr:AAA family ATPase [Jiangellales bacterium]
MIVGRDLELDALAAVLESARSGRAAALCLVGEAGAGKTTLLEAAEEAAEGFRRLRATGFQSETSLGHAGLLEALGPLEPFLDGLPGAQRGALDAALGRSDTATPGDRYLVAAATLSLLARAAEGQPVLVAVEDLQWLDRESTAALTFAARRLRHDAVAFVLASRPGAFADLTAGIDTLAVPGLPVGAAEQLLGGTVSARLVPELVEATGGNPLALLETSRRLTPAQRRGVTPLPDHLPVGTRLVDAFAAEVVALPGPSRRAAILLAASGEPAEGPVAAALAASGADAGAALDRLERAGVVVREGPALSWRHPLLRAATWQSARPEERRAAHVALADVLAPDPLRALRHRAEAAVGHDDGLATELTRLADGERSRRGFAAASTLEARAALLTSDPAGADHLSAAAVEDAFFAGDTATTRELASKVLADTDDGPARGRVLAVLAQLELYSGSVPRGRDLLVEAAELAEGRHRVTALWALANACYMRDDRAGMLRAGEELAVSADRSDPEQRMLADATLGAALVFAGRLDEGRALAGAALRLVETDPRMRDDPKHLTTALLLIRWAGDLHGADVLAATRRIRRARELGALGVLPQALAFTAAGRALLGDHEGAYADAGEAAELGAELGYGAIITIAYEVLAWEAAARGLHDDALRALAESRRLTERAEVADVAQALPLSEAACALARGDLAEVVRVLEQRVAADGGRDVLDDPFGVAPDLAEAYVGLGRREDARSVADRYRRLHAGAADARTRARTARVTALAEDDDVEAVGAFRTAVAAAEEGGDAFEAARSRLLLGSRLRRAGERRAAREELRRARDTFVGMGLQAWSRRAEDELAATGETRRGRVGTDEPLTAQETRVALLVAEGLTNKEAAAALFLSPRTVEHHLGSVLRKRGLRSRTQLAAAMAGAGAAALSPAETPTYDEETGSP